jgi:hypothetical protein
VAEGLREHQKNIQNDDLKKIVFLLFTDRIVGYENRGKAYHNDYRGMIFVKKRRYVLSYHGTLRFLLAKFSHRFIINFVDEVNNDFF